MSVGAEMSEAAGAVAALLELMAHLRDRERGCPWDREQTFASIAPYTIEEAYEVADAIERGDREHLLEELGDLLFQVVFHARMAQERGWFDFAAVARTIREKLVRRHPHLFAGAVLEPHELVHAWERQKAEERAAAGGGSGVLAGIPRSFPALTRAEKLSRRAARVGFDWPDAQAVRAKVLEELAEIDAAAAAAGSPFAAGSSPLSDRSASLVEELGDLLFAVVNWSRHLHVDAESALRAANGKFERRFERMERLACEGGRRLEELSAAEWDRLWQAAKLNPG